MEESNKIENESKLENHIDPEGTTDENQIEETSESTENDSTDPVPEQTSADTGSESEETSNQNEPKNDDSASDVAKKDVKEEKSQEEQEPTEDDKKKHVVDKTKIIDELRLLIKKEKEAGPAFDEFNAIKERWHNSGHVNPTDEKSLQHDFNVLVDEFYYNAKIYRELREYSLEKNLELKNELIHKIESLNAIESVKQVEYLIRVYQKEWSSIGPTLQDKWPEVRNKYYDTVNKIYERIHHHYEEVHKFHEEAYNEKKALIEKVDSLNKLDISKFKDWQKHTEEVIEIQQLWKKTGFLNKKQNDECWAEFKKACDLFFEKKKAHFDKSKAQQQENKEAKKKLIEAAGDIKDSEDWKEATEQFIQLQKEWKKIGPANRSDEQKLWKKFKSACDDFFAAKKEFYATIDDRRRENLVLKEDLIKEINNYTSKGVQDEDLEALKDFALRWKAIDQVPSGSIDSINQSYNKAVSKIYSALDMDKHEKDILKFKHKLDGYKDSSKREDLFRKERNQMRDRISKTQSELYSLEDKMGFFKNTNHANPLRDELIKKIDAQKELLNDLKEKYKLIPKN
ncbi:MAG: DUF349 domain-containing protein [Chitinophagales bacterium]|nr:DUF349 domain-containing protein [Chitinophagales bacterium]